MAHHEVRVFLLFKSFFLAAVDGSALFHTRLAVLSVGIEFHLRGVGLSVEQRAVAILVAAQIVTQRENVFR